MSVIVHSARIVDGGRETPDGWARWDDGRITHRGTGTGWCDHDGDTIVDARALAGPDAVLSPGFIDLHGHGGGGRSYEDGPDAVRAARALHLAHGTTRAVLSLATSTLDDLVDRLRMIAALTRTAPDILGSHLEGPFLAPGHRGAHAGDLLRAPDPETLDALLAAGGGTVRQVTLAPELPGGLDAVRRIVEAGVVAAVGHTSADARIATAAFDAGATVLTHAFNAMPGLHHRFPGPVGAALADDRVVLEIIADGVHLHPDVVRIAASAAVGRFALVTDAMAAAGAADGVYRLGALDVEVTSGVAHVAGTDTIAGSTLTQDAALRVAVAAGVPLVAAVQALTETPARVLGREDLGTLEPGRLADAVLLSADLRVARVWLGGEPV
ncbi:N-acetylglucosamine-6-phosphate deacetylase [Microbacterium binotii]|uniref:N-acetylglucosamine-6-phosphate deacetylase n=1 Tax=Microbacterium binotii TaxID=462710 RepID=UPI001F2C43F9|nr:N-acetylglucosamine-6-phosphate deacetylase [Microbacterium binotii]UIN29954.1 N-acetylglucosamine-6-phosphate deacetylase [Microbacterium binotii]